MTETNLIIKREYIELVNLLNTGNKTKNQKTEVNFLIKANGFEKQLFAEISKDQKLFLCLSLNEYWIVASSTQFINLSKFICNLLNTKKIFEPVELSQLIRNSIFLYI